MGVNDGGPQNLAAALNGKWWYITCLDEQPHTTLRGRFVQLASSQNQG